MMETMAQIKKRLAKYQAPTGPLAKYARRNPCVLCGWAEHMAIHQNPQLNGKAGYHDYRGAKP